MSRNSYDHDNVSFIEWINNSHFSCHRITVLNHVWKYSKSVTATSLTIGVKLDGEDEQVKKRKKDLFG